MTKERKASLCDEMLSWASEMFRYYKLYEWARDRGMTGEEIQDEFCFEDDEMEEYKEEYKNSFKK